MKVLSLFIGLFVTIFCNAQTEQEESIDSLRPPPYSDKSPQSIRYCNGLTKNVKLATRN